MTKEEIDTLNKQLDESEDLPIEITIDDFFTGDY